MEQACHRCGSVLSADPSFCSQCGAPQVRVPESLTASAENANVSGSDRVLTPATLGMGLNRRNALKAASIAGAAMMFAVMIPRVNTLLPLWLLFGGWLTVTIYRRSSAFAVTPKSGALLGALGGLVGFIFVSIVISAFLAIQIAVLHQGDRLQTMWRSQIELAAAANPDAQALVTMSRTPEGLASLLISGLFIVFILFLLFSCAGGIFGAFFGRTRAR